MSSGSTSTSALKTGTGASVQNLLVAQSGIGSNIIVNPCQRGNPILQCIKKVGQEYGDIVADYQVGRTTGALYLSLKYHRLHPEYIHQRIEKLGTSYNLRILLLMCDVSGHQDFIRELTKICLINNITIMVAWTTEEAGHYLSTYKQFENKSPNLIKERVERDHNSMLRTALTNINKVNKTDVEILRTSVGSFADIAKATSDQLLQLPGFGQVKVRRIRDAFEKPFRTNATSTLRYLSQSQVQTEGGPAVLGNRGKERESRAATEVRNLSPDTTSQRGRESSPMWDIELDLNDSPLPSNTTTAAASGSRKRPPSPVWDIELDLNECDDEENTRVKRRRNDEDMVFEPTDPL